MAHTKDHLKRILQKRKKVWARLSQLPRDGNKERHQQEVHHSLHVCRRAGRGSEVFV